ncbi:MAG: bifunctional lysylphosphatidylglycerol flippase/synthetase MprF [Deltaproteobacteria bacterium]|nr:bifunctional lysylphosphatidylglycerol flippase/synthetase MprF [Deltaproteobacteria bacterium]
MLQMKTASLKRLVPFLGLSIFILAVIVIYRQLHDYRLHDILTRIEQIPHAQFGLALALTVLSYAILTFYDLLALRYIGHPIEIAKTALTSFLGYAFSNNIGFSMIAGASVRYRLYSTWGLSALEITQVVLFCTTSLWLGFFVLSGVVFVSDPLALPQSLHWSLTTVRPLGIVLLAAAGIYFVATLQKNKTLAFKEWRFSLPSWRLATAQMATACADWLMAGAVLYCLLPAGTFVGFGHFLEIFLLAQLAGLVSQVPGGLGIFESVILTMSPAGTATPGVMGALVVYRAIYYLLPLMAATLALGIEELMRKRKLMVRIQSLAGGAVDSMFIPLLSVSVFVSGAILLFSGSLPAIPHRMTYLHKILPLPFLEISHFLGSLFGVGLLLLARGIQKRVDAAYLLAVSLLALGVVVSLLKGFDYEEASVLSLVLIGLLPCRRFFFRRTALLSESFTPAWLAAIAGVVISSIWLGFFAFRHVAYSHDLWWHFSVWGDAPRFLRATVGAFSLILLFGIAHLIKPAHYRPVNTATPLPGSVEAIVAKSPVASANLALLGDKQFLIDDNQQAFIMYGTTGETWVAMGDPVGPTDLWPELLWQFRREADRYADRAVFYEVGHAHLHLYLDIGLSVLKIGEEARVPLSDFSLDGSQHKKLRYIHNKLSKLGCTFEIIPKASVPAQLDVLKTISDTWLKEKNTREKGFSLGFFDTAYIGRFPIGVVRSQNRIVAFTNIWEAADSEELSADLMRYLPDAPYGVMDYLFIELLLWGHAQGYRWFNLGMAPLSGMKTHEMAPLWHRIGNLVFRFGDHFYNFQGLRAYKDKFDPVWQPKYIAAPGGLTFPRSLTDIGSLISGGLKGILFR